MHVGRLHEEIVKEIMSANSLIVKRYSKCCGVRVAHAECSKVNEDEWDLYIQIHPFRQNTIMLYDIFDISYLYKKLRLNEEELRRFISVKSHLCDKTTYTLV